MTNNKKKILPWIHLALAVTVGGATLFGLSRPLGPAPALAPAFVPGTGVWTDLKQVAKHHVTQDLLIPGLRQPVQITFEADGTPHVKAKHDEDMWRAVGYLHASNRLFQMDLMRRQGSGMLAEILGAGALPADEFQRQLGLRRTAELEWAQIPSGPTRTMIESYTAGVNAVIDSQTASSTLPMTFKLLGTAPRPWEPQDTLVLKGVLAQMMSLSDQPLYRALYADTLGYERTMEWFPIQPPNPQTPYMPGPYAKPDPQPMPLSAAQIYQGNAQAASGDLLDKATVTAVRSLLDRIAQLPAGTFHAEANSNAWAVDGTKTASGKPMLAGDPHLTLSLPSVWYQVQVESPGYRFGGVTVPGIPLALIGKNEQISWSMTNGQNQQTYYYKEKVDEQNENRYFWNGEWRDMEVRTEQIPIKGGGSKELTIRSTIHGPIINNLGQTVSINWLGAIPSTPSGGLDSLRRVMQAERFDQFKEAFRHWQAPAMNYLYADQKGNIGLIGAGLYPVFPESSQPWLPMLGTGEDDFVGRIPYEQLPQVYNPPNHVIGTANQRQTGPDYPYYTGTTSDYAPGYRANRIYEQLQSGEGFTSERFAALQNDVYDPLAAEIVPVLLQTLRSKTLSEQERKALDSLQSWDYRMDADSVPAALWWTFWQQYAVDVFDPWLKKYNVPTDQYERLGEVQWHAPLHQSLQMWTLQQPDHPVFANPQTGTPRTAPDVMQGAFQAAVRSLVEKQGDDLDTWQWQNLHVRAIDSLLQIPALGYGPKGSSGGNYTVNVAPGLRSPHGPSWRMIVDWGTGQAFGSYPGGQSENPLSPLYQDRIEDWWHGKYRPMLNFDQSAQNAAYTWTLQPGKEEETQ